MARQQFGPSPANALDAATKQYVDAQIAANTGSSGPVVVVGQTNTIPAGRTGYWIQLDANNNVLTMWVENNLATTNLIASATVRRVTSSSVFTYGNGTGALDTTTYHEGTSSLRVTSNATGTAPYVTPTTYTDGAPVTASSTYTGVVSVNPASSGEQFSAILNWYQSGGTFISQSLGTSTVTQANIFTTVSVTATAPSGAAYATVQAQSTFPFASVEYFNADEFGIQSGTNTIWQM